MLLSHLDRRREDLVELAKTAPTHEPVVDRSCADHIDERLVVEPDCALNRILTARNLPAIRQLFAMNDHYVPGPPIRSRSFTGKLESAELVSGAMPAHAFAFTLG